MSRLAACVALLASLVVGRAVAAPAVDFRVVLLGTGAPEPRVDRFGPATLVVAGRETILFDVGRGAAQRLWQLGVPLREVRTVFLTHLHSDHVVGLPDLWLTGWLPGAFGRRTEALAVRGPRGTAAMMRSLREAFRWDVEVRSEGAEQGLAGVACEVADVTEGLVFDRNDVRVTAFAVDHGKHLEPALGYRVDFAGHSVVISGDTRYSENLIRAARGTDVLVHEVFAASSDVLARSEIVRAIAGYHTLPEDAGRVFASVKPKLAAYTHIAQTRVDAANSTASMEDVIRRTRRAYDGPLVVGEDLMTISIGPTVEVRRFTPHR